MRIFLLLFFSFSLYAGNNLEKVFTDMYQVGTWDEKGYSFSGSEIELSKEYVVFLQEFLKKK